MLRRVERAGVRGLARLPRSVIERVGARAPVNSDGERLAPEIAVGLAVLNRLPRSDFSERTVEGARRQIDQEAQLFASPYAPFAVEEDVVIPGPSGPIPATRALFARNGLGADDVDLYEVNEAFAAVLAAWRREIDPDMDRVNVNGGAIALGHPLGSSGARLITTILHELERSDTELGLVTMCCGGGIGTGTLLQRI